MPQRFPWTPWHRVVRLDEQSGLKGRELEQVVCTVFFCSQPVGQRRTRAT